MSKSEQIMAQADEVLLRAYNRFPVVFSRGEGVTLYDEEGKSYLDFGSGIGVNALGYGHPAYTQALTQQVGKLMHVSNLYYTAPLEEAARALTEKSGLSRVFFTNSGAEAIEGAIKAAKKYASRRDGHSGHEIIAMEHSFHGRTVGAVSVTGTAHYREPFEPLMGGVRFARFNDLESVKAQVTEKTCAIILETVQGEGGIYPADPDFLAGVRALCDEKDILLILDEVQCGMGRTGSWYAWQTYGVKPDIMATAKALGCGVPVGAFVLGEKTAESSIEPGDHGSTYGGNPLAAAAVSAVFSIFEQEDILGHVKETAPYLEEKLDALCASSGGVLAGRRGMGFMQGLIVREDLPAGKIAAAALQAGLIVLTAGGNVLRLLPPLVVTRSDIDRMCEILGKVITSLQ